MRRDKHHLTPKHRGGTDSDGLVEVTKTQHAMFHWCEWQRLGLQEDRIAWLALCGNLRAGELSEEKEALRIANMKGKKRTPEQCKRISEARKALKGKIKRTPLTEEQKNNIRVGRRKAKWGNMTDEEIKAHKRHLAKLKSRRLRARKGHT